MTIIFWLLGIQVSLGQATLLTVTGFNKLVRHVFFFKAVNKKSNHEKVNWFASRNNWLLSVRFWGLTFIRSWLTTQSQHSFYSSSHWTPSLHLHSLLSAVIMTPTGGSVNHVEYEKTSTSQPFWTLPFIVSFLDHQHWKEALLTASPLIRPTNTFINKDISLLLWGTRRGGQCRI